MVTSPSTTPDIRVQALASGSSGNSTLISAGTTNLLIDAGMPIRSLVKALERYGVRTGNLAAILLTHEHTDHASSAVALARQFGAPLVATADTLDRCLAEPGALCEAVPIERCTEFKIADLHVRPFPVPHDAADPVGYCITSGSTRIVYLTDCGSVTPAIREAVRGAQLAIVEANHDLDRLMRGPYSSHLKARVASDTGHLSNEACGRLVAETLADCGPMTVWLAHLSRVNNSPRLARESVGRIARASRVPFDLQVALRDSPSVSWRPGKSVVQLALI